MVLSHTRSLIWLAHLLPHANEVSEGYVFTRGCLSTWGHIMARRACMAGSAWQGGVHGSGCMAGGMCMEGVCVVGVCVWQGVCIAERGCTCQGGMHGSWVCMAGGCAWQGGMHGTHAPPSRYYEIQSMSRWHASYWNAFLLHCAIRESWPISQKDLTESKDLRQ